MSDDHDFDASDGRRPMIYRRNRIVATACTQCRLSLIACQANRDINRAACCDGCGHGDAS